MLVRVVATPNLSFLDLLHCANLYGFKFIHLDPLYESRYKLIHPPLVRVFSHLRPIYTAHVKYLELNYPRLSASKENYLVLVGGSPVEHFEYQLESYEGAGITPELLHSWDTFKHQKLPARTKDTSSLIHEGVGEGSLLQKIYPLFYRERDKQARLALQTKVYAYLVGDRKTPPITGIGKFDLVLQQPETLKLRQAVIYARSTSTEAASLKFGIDKFELNYLTQKVENV